MKRIIGIIIVIICAISLFTVKNYGLGLVFTALAIFLIVMALKKKKRHTAPSPISSSPAPAPVHPSSVNPMPKPSPSAPSPFQIRKDNSETLKFKIAGVTFSGRQNTLRKIDEMEDDRYIACSYGIDQTEFQGSPAFRIYAQLSDDNIHITNLATTFYFSNYYTLKQDNCQHRHSPSKAVHFICSALYR